MGGFSNGPSVNIDIYLEMKTSRMGGGGGVECLFVSLKNIDVQLVH